jgi:hypothetical protein
MVGINIKCRDLGFIVDILSASSRLEKARRKKDYMKQSGSSAYDNIIYDASNCISILTSTIISFN